MVQSGEVLPPPLVARLNKGRPSQEFLAVARAIARMLARDDHEREAKERRS
jgi:hypothetical protein